MIHEVSIQNFKSLRDVTVKLERFTVFVGANGSGKTSILQALDQVCRSADCRTAYDATSLRQWESKGATDRVEIAVETAERSYRCYFPPRPDSDYPAVTFSQVHLGGSTRDVGTKLEAGDWKPWRPESVKPDPLMRSLCLRLETSKLVHVSVFQQDPSGMAPDGTGLHAALLNMNIFDPDAWRELQQDLRVIAPAVKRLRHAKFAPGQGQVTSLLFDMAGAEGLTAEFVSEGTLLVLGLLTALRVSDRPDLILLDDIDHGLHPKAQQDLVALLRRMLEASPRLQIVATTHSPYLLDCMDPSEIRMTSLQADGSTACAPLQEHPKFEKWKKEMAPGEMWTLFGEKWVAEKEAAV